MSEIKKHWEVHEPQKGCPLSIRALKPKGSPLDLPTQNHILYPDKYGTLEALKTEFEQRALDLNEAGYNVYTVMNRIRPDMYLGAVSDKDITHRDLLLVDIDRKEGTDQPATEADIQDAKNLADDVMKTMSTFAFSVPKVVMSANGIHLYYKLDGIPESDDGKEKIRSLLYCLNQMHSHPNVAIDTTVFNAARITKVIGTIARKGVESPDRPFRKAVLL
jgi:hypothetical protein